MSATATDTIELTPPATAVLNTRKTSIQDDEDRLPARSRTMSDQAALQKGTTAVIFASITGVTGISSLLAGLVTVVLPKMAKDLSLSDSVLLWYFFDFHGFLS